MCGSKWAWEVTRDILSSLKDHLRWRRGEQSGGSGEPEPTSTCPSHHCNTASKRERWDTLGEWELSEAREGHQWALAAAAVLEEWIERLSQSNTRMRLDICHHSQSWDWPRRRSLGQSQRHHRAPPEEGHQVWSPMLSLTGSHWWATFHDPGTVSKEEQGNWGGLC